jgi:type VI secretion system secreted protein Hcp
MAIDSYMGFQVYSNSKYAANATSQWLNAESQVDLSSNTGDLLYNQLTALQAGSVFEVEDYSFDIEQTLNIGSQSSGAGAGKVTFNPFSITRKIDKASPIMYEMACSGVPFQTVCLALRKSSGTGSAGSFFLRFDFKLVAVKTISYAHDDESPKETLTFEYGGLQVRYLQQNPDGTLAKAAVAGGWNRVKNTQDTTATMLT